MAEPEVEAAWHAEFERSGVKELRDDLGGDGLTDELKRQPAFRRLGDQAEAQQTCRVTGLMSAFGGKADMARTGRNVR